MKAKGIHMEVDVIPSVALKPQPLRAHGSWWEDMGHRDERPAQKDPNKVSWNWESHQLLWWSRETSSIQSFLTQRKVLDKGPRLKW